MSLSAEERARAAAIGRINKKINSNTAVEEKKEIRKNVIKYPNKNKKYIGKKNNNKQNHTSNIKKILAATAIGAGVGITAYAIHANIVSSSKAYIQQIAQAEKGDLGYNEGLDDLAEQASIIIKYEKNGNRAEADEILYKKALSRIENCEAELKKIYLDIVKEKIRKCFQIPETQNIKMVYTEKGEAGRPIVYAKLKEEYSESAISEDKLDVSVFDAVTDAVGLDKDNNQMQIIKKIINAYKFNKKEFKVENGKMVRDTEKEKKLNNGGASIAKQENVIEDSREC